MPDLVPVAAATVAPVVRRTDKTRGERRKMRISQATEKITPEKALKLLEDTETVEEFRNRGISDGKVSLWKENMIKGTWEITHQGIAIYYYLDKNKWIILDGQHRLWAIVKAEIPVYMMVARYEAGPLEEAVEIMKSFDRGQKRSLGQVLTIADGTTRGTTRVAACRYLLAFLRSGGTADTRHLRLTDAEIVASTERYRPDLDWLITLKRGSGNVFLSAPVAAALIYAHSTPYADAVEKFGRQLAGGEGIFAGDPAMTFRDWVLNKGSDNLLRRPEGRMLFMRIAFKAIQASVEDKKITRFVDSMDGFEFFRKSKGKDK